MRLTALLSFALLLAGCGEPTPASRTATLFAAASTQDAVVEVLADGAKQGLAVSTNFGNSATLAKQIEAGAEAGVYLSASSSWADYLNEKGLVRQRRDLLGNRLVVIVPTDSKLAIASPADLATAPIEHLALADTGSAPAGIYAKQALEKLKLWDALQAKTIDAADVRDAVHLVERGEAEAGIVYATDAAATPGVKVALELDPTLTEPIVYTLVLVKRDQPSDSDRQLYDLLSSSAANKIFYRHGFIPLQISASDPANK